MTEKVIPAAPIYLTPAELCERFGGNVGIRTLANWRSAGTGGPEFTRMGGRIFYRLDLVEAWERSLTFKSTADYSRKGT